MARWQPDAHARLESAALELFTDRGFDAVSTAEIAGRAGLTKATFFRYFPDKPEVLFWGRDLLADVFRRTITDGAEGASPLELVEAALLAVAPLFDIERHRHAGARQRLIESSAALRERAVLKRAVLAESMSEALRARRVADETAVLAGLTGAAAFDTAYAKWATNAAYRRFGGIAKRELDRLARAATNLTAPTDRFAHG